MKPTLLPLFSTACALLLEFPALGGSQDPDQATLIAAREAKLAAPFLKRAAWHTDYEAARNAAGTEEKLILAYITRSYAPSPPCEALENGFFSSESFVEAAREVVLYCHITSGVTGDPHQEFPRELGVWALPFVVALDEEGRPIARAQEPVNQDSVLGLIDKEMVDYRALRTLAAGGDKDAKAKFLMRRIELGHLEADDIQAELVDADYLSEEQEQTIRSGLAGLMLMEILLRTRDGDPENSRKLVEAVMAMKEAGSIPTGEMAFFFWQVVLGHADQTADAALFTEALTKIKAMPIQDPKWMKRMETRQRALEFLKGRKKKDK